MAELAAQSGRILAEDGTTVNLADLLGGEDTGETADIEKFAPHSGRFIKEDGSIVNISGNIGGGGSGGGGTTLEPLTLEIGGTTYTYDGSEAVTVAIGTAEGVAF